MAMEITNSYSSYAPQSVAEKSTANTTKKKETEKTEESLKSDKEERTADYAGKLAKLVPSVEFKVGSTFSTAKYGKTLTVNPKLLEKMQNNPEQEKEMKELIKGVETATRLVDSFYKARGVTVVYRHGYIDENGKFYSCAYTKKDDRMNQKLREEGQKNAEKLIEKNKEKAAKKKKELQKALEEKRAEKESKETTHDKVEKFMDEKLEASKDGKIYLYDTDIKTLIEAAKEGKEEDSAIANTKEQAEAGANLDVQV